MKSPKNIRLVILTDEKQMAALRKLSEKTGAPIGEIVRRAIAAYLKGAA